MNYTLVCKSAYEGNTFHVVKTFKSKREAQEFVDRIASADPADYGYFCRIVRHKKPIMQQTRTSGGLVVFGDGTWAWIEPSLSFREWLESKLGQT
jgi:hypothetical protein